MEATFSSSSSAALSAIASAIRTPEDLLLYPPYDLAEALDLSLKEAEEARAALAAWGAGWLHDRTGSYQLSFIIAGVACLVAAIGVLQIGNRPTDPTLPTHQVGGEARTGLS